MNWYKIAKNKKKEISLSGTLKKTPNNFVYLDISNDIMNGLFEMLDEEKGVKKPPYNQKSFNNVGAHITVIGSTEFEEKNIGKIEEIGRSYEFETKKSYSVNPDGWDEMERVWFMGVSSPDLEKLRKKYNLSSLPDGNDFHITFAIKEK
jgi:hypothetical protein